MKFPTLSAAALAALVVGACLCGCESSEGNSVELSASVRDLSVKGQTSVLTAKGWNNYKWTLSDNSIGRLDRDVGSRVVYTALSMPAEGAAYQNQVVTCQTTDSGDGAGAFATITLRHVSKGGTASASASTNNASKGGGGATTAKLAITPKSRTLSPGETLKLSVDDPLPGHTYRWNVVESGTSDGSGEVILDSGSVSPENGSSTTYRAPSNISRNATVSVQCTDTTTKESAICIVTFR